jgi:hypothetical protein
MKEDEMGGACSMLEYKVKYFRKVIWEYVEWLKVPQKSPMACICKHSDEHLK